MSYSLHDGITKQKIENWAKKTYIDILRFRGLGAYK